MIPPAQPKHVRWFGRSEDDPNAILIIEDEHSRVFLDAEHREELYSVINTRTRPTTAPSKSVTLTSIEIALRKEENPSENIQWAIEKLNQYQEQQEQHDTAIRNATLDDFAQWIKTEWVQESIKDYKEEIRTQDHP